jgi:hypothetical protein
MIKIAIVVVAATVLAAVQFDYFQVQRDNLAVSRLRENEVAGYAPESLGLSLLRHEHLRFDLCVDSRWENCPVQQVAL